MRSSGIIEKEKIEKIIEFQLSKNVYDEWTVKSREVKYFN